MKTSAKKSLHGQPPQDPKQLHHSKTVTTSLKKNIYLKWEQRLLIVNTHKDFSHNQFFAKNGEGKPSTK